LASAISARGSSVAGLIVLKYLPLAGATHLPSMKSELRGLILTMSVASIEGA